MQFCALTYVCTIHTKISKCVNFHGFHGLQASYPRLVKCQKISSTLVILSNAVLYCATIIDQHMIALLKFLNPDTLRT